MGIFRTADVTLIEYNPVVLYTIVGAASKVAGERAVKYVQDEIKKGGHDDTGALVQSIKSRSYLTPLGVEFEVYSEKNYAGWINDGTGIYGPYGTPIVRPGGGVMKFNPGKRKSGAVGVGRRGATNAYGGGGQFTGSVYSRAVQGQSGAHFFEKALARIRIATFV